MGKSQVLGEPKRWQSVLQQLSPSPELKPPPHLWVSLAAETRISDPTDVGISGLWCLDRKIIITVLALLKFKNFLSDLNQCNSIPATIGSHQPESCEAMHLKQLSNWRVRADEGRLSEPLLSYEGPVRGFQSTSEQSQTGELNASITGRVDASLWHDLESNWNPSDSQLLRARWEGANLRDYSLLGWVQSHTVKLNSPVQGSAAELHTPYLGSAFHV